MWDHLGKEQQPPDLFKSFDDLEKAIRARHPENGRWVTLNGGTSNETGEHHGVHVFINGDGQITKGPKALVDQGAKPADTPAGPSAADVEKYSQMARDSYHAKTPEALENALNVIKQGATHEHFSKAMKEAEEKHGQTSDHRNIFTALYREAKKVAPAKHKVGDWVTFPGAQGRRIKGQITEMDHAAKEYTVRPHDNVYKEHQTFPESLLQPHDETKLKKSLDLDLFKSIEELSRAIYE